MRKFLNVDDISNILNYSKSWVYQNYKKEHKKNKFPLPVGGSRALRWDSEAVNIWMNLRLPTDLQSNDNSPSNYSFEAALAANANNL